MNLEAVKVKTALAVDLFRSNDSQLFDFDRLELPERPISHRIGFYLQLLFGEYDVDCEYNKHLEGKKTVEGDEYRPDAVVHKRKRDDYNLLVVEIKARRDSAEAEADQREIERDYDKLRKFTRQDGGLGYAWGVSILLLSDETKTKWFANGEPI